MESYSIAFINTILKGNNELLVVKGISDFAKNKQDTEQVGNKELAKKNSAHFTFELIKHLQQTVFGFNQNVKIK
jgi:nucleoside phosphorylase